MEKTESIRISKEVKAKLDKVKRPGQSYDGALQELLARKGALMKSNPERCAHEE